MISRMRLFTEEYIGALGVDKESQDSRMEWRTLQGKEAPEEVTCVVPKIVMKVTKRAQCLALEVRRTEGDKY